MDDIEIGSKWRNRDRPHFVVTVVGFDGNHIQFESETEYVAKDVHLIARSMLLERYEKLED